MLWRMKRRVCTPPPADLEVQGGLERLATYGRGAVVEGAGEQFQARPYLSGLARRLLQVADERFQAAAAHIFERGIQARSGSAAARRPGGGPAR